MLARVIPTFKTRYPCISWKPDCLPQCFSVIEPNRKPGLEVRGELLCPVFNSEEQLRLFSKAYLCVSVPYFISCLYRFIIYWFAHVGVERHTHTKKSVRKNY